MSFLDQQSVDDLLAQVQAETSAVAADAGVSASGSGDALEIDGEMEPPPVSGGAASAEDTGLAGEFAPPPVLPAGASSEYRRLLAIDVPVIVRLGQRRMTVGEVMRMSVGAILEFHKPSDEELELLVNNKPVGKGHAVKVGENFGIKITKIGPLRETIRKLGGLA